MANINIRVSDETKALIHSNAKAAGLTATSWIELKCAGEPPKRKAPTKDRAALIRALAGSGKIYQKLVDIDKRLDGYAGDFSDIRNDIKAIQAMATFTANKIHDEFDYDS